MNINVSKCQFRIKMDSGTVYLQQYSQSKWKTILQDHCPQNKNEYNRILNMFMAKVRAITMPEEVTHYLNAEYDPFKVCLYDNKGYLLSMMPKIGKRKDLDNIDILARINEEREK